MPTSQALALRAGCHESGSSSSMEARRSNTDRAMFPLYGTRSSIGAIPAFYPMVLTGRVGLAMRPFLNTGDADIPCLRARPCR